LSSDDPVIPDFDRISTAGIARRGEFYLVAKRIRGTSIGESWEFPGGKNRREETPEMTLRREYREELSIDVTVGRLLFTSSFENRGTTYLLVAYEVFLADEDPDFALVEHSQIAWKRLEQLQEMQMAASDRAIVTALSEAEQQTSR
jgi:8-oxo-dGTP diphosphatase